MYRLLIFGCHRWYCRDLANRFLDAMQAEHSDLIVVFDGRGEAVKAFREAAIERAVPFETHQIAAPGTRTWQEYEVDRLAATACMVGWGADYCLVCDPHLVPGKFVANQTRLALRAGITTRWVERTDGELRPVADTETLRPDPKPNFAHYWEHVHI